MKNFASSASRISLLVSAFLAYANFAFGQLVIKGKDYDIDYFEVTDKSAFEALWALNLKLKAAHGVLAPIYVTANYHPSGRVIRLHEVLSREEKIRINLKNTTFWTAFNTIISTKKWHWRYGDLDRIIVYP